MCFGLALSDRWGALMKLNRAPSFLLAGSVFLIALIPAFVVGIILFNSHFGPLADAPLVILLPIAGLVFVGLPLLAARLTYTAVRSDAE